MNVPDKAQTLLGKLVLRIP